MYLSHYSLMIGHWKIALGMAGMWVLLMLNYEGVILQRKERYPLWKVIGLCLVEGWIIEAAGWFFRSQKGTYYGFQVERKTVLARMQEMGIQAIYPRQSTSRRDPSHKVYPHLLKDVSAAYPDHVWSIDITYIPIQKSWLYLTAIIDWYSRYVLAWEINDTLEIPFVLDACRRALERSQPVIMILKIELRAWDDAPRCS